MWGLPGLKRLGGFEKVCLVWLGAYAGSRLGWLAGILVGMALAWAFGPPWSVKSSHPGERR
jgi:hypothetical protein